MGALSKSSRVCFEILNELYTAVGAGVLGMLVLIQHGFRSHQTLKCLSVVGLTSASLVYVFSREKQKIVANKKKVVVITGCDSGLGFSLAQHAADSGFTVIATFLNLDSKGSLEIKRLYGGYIIQIQLDITDSISIQNCVQTLEHYFSKNPGYSLHALVNNAGVMVFGEFEWQTEKLMRQQIEVNLLGTLKITNAFCHLLRHHKGRVVTVSSHCALANLPGLSVYGATKAALNSWNDGLRVEMAKYGVQVVTFIPGSFVAESSIMSKQLQYVQEMHDNFTEEQHHFYSDYFKRYNIYLSFISGSPEPQKIQDDHLYTVFEDTLLDKEPNALYKHEPLRYKFYHFLFKISPIFIRDMLVTRFMTMPQYKVETPSDDDFEDLSVS
ncbi:D-beta-hydroxybutyrate dehydrogenase, mitochondrial [Anthonomus grandis grandis]|uniref:D-beta-hydroxybutyrate dehydrogenase, mitochondrial n=1 Tax=Anthonomus grandis grandis TaxID=2921223 RepID=UPI002166274C|nr:D-beta-hydroxybutyrate dehydrogenase, mitochondrial [Anthonomus grandis grandis]